jgi:hypothetical protein
LNRVSANDVNAILCAYGVEAARQAIVNEVSLFVEKWGSAVSNHN